MSAEEEKINSNRPIIKDSCRVSGWQMSESATLEINKNILSEQKYFFLNKNIFSEQKYFVCTKIFFSEQKYFV